jgi:hypothetical protein
MWTHRDASTTTRQPLTTAAQRKTEGKAEVEAIMNRLVGEGRIVGPVENLLNAPSVGRQ